MNFTEMLMQFNLTKQEALIYTTLLAEGCLTGYEVAKLTGISRSNIYTALAGLVEKGAAYLIEGAAARYTPAPVEEFCANRIRIMQQYKRELLSSIPAQSPNVDGYITIKGKQNILNKMRNMIDDAGERVYVSVSAETMEMIMTEIEGAAARGIKIVIITDGQLAPQGTTVYRAVMPQHQIRLITDSKAVLTGDIEDGENSTCLYSLKKNLIDLFKDALKNEIRLIEYERGKTT